jgi:hypothetical protein
MKLRDLLLVVVAVVPTASAAQDDLTKFLNLDTAGVNALAIDANVAELRLVTAAVAQLRVEVTLSSRDHDRLAQCAKSELRSRRVGATLHLALSQPGRQRCGERWSLEVPAGLAVDARTDVGSIDATLKGQYGDVNVDASVGRAALTVDGHRLLTTRRHGPSESIRVDGTGATVSLKSGVGNVTVVVTTRP